jgi:uncharacterized protein YqgC (DUF456 family)
MAGLPIILRVLLGSVLITGGIIGMVIPVVPGLPLLILGLSIGLTWHPRGLALWRRMKAAALRLLARIFGRRKPGPEIKPES